MLAPTLILNHPGGQLYGLRGPDGGGEPHFLTFTRPDALGPT
jgi:hypothetical protein